MIVKDFILSGYFPEKVKTHYHCLGLFIICQNVPCILFFTEEDVALPYRMNEI